MRLVRRLFLLLLHANTAQRMVKTTEVTTMIFCVGIGFAF